MNSWYKLIQICVFVLKVARTHMFEGVMGHRHGSGLLQVVIPVEVRHILSRVSIWNTQNIFLFSNLLSNILSYSFHAVVHRIILTRLQWLLTHAGAPSRPRLEALRRGGGGLLSSESKRVSAGPKTLATEKQLRQGNIEMQLWQWTTLYTGGE